MRASFVLALAVSCATVAACDGEAERPPNIVWVVWDTTRADHLSLYGYSKPTTPFLEEFAKDARVFDDCLSSSSWTVPSHASMFTGLLPAEHGAQHGHEQLDENLTTVAERLKGAGYATFAWTANPHLDDDFLQGFDVQRHPWDPDQVERANEILDRKLAGGITPRELSQRRERGGKQSWVLKAAGELAGENWHAWLDQRDEQQPFFAFFNFMEAHRPLVPPREFREKLMTPELVQRSYEVQFPFNETWAYCFGLREYDASELEVMSATYDAALLELDTLLRELVKTLAGHASLEDTVVIVTADHGEHLGEHHLLDHQYSLSQELIRVPLVVRFPKRFAPGRDASPVMSMDLYPTLLELAGVEAPTPGAGHARSLLAPLAARRPRFSDYSKPFPAPLESMRKEHPDQDISRFESGVVALVDSPWKLVHELGSPAQLHDLASDPGETRDLSAAKPEVRERMGKAMKNLLKSLQPIGGSQTPAERSAAMEQMFRDLGYAGGDDEEEEEDPKSAPPGQNGAPRKE